MVNGEDGPAAATSGRHSHRGKPVARDFARIGACIFRGIEGGRQPPSPARRPPAKTLPRTPRRPRSSILGDPVARRIPEKPPEPAETASEPRLRLPHVQSGPGACSPARHRSEMPSAERTGLRSDCRNRPWGVGDTPGSTGLSPFPRPELRPLRSHSIRRHPSHYCILQGIHERSDDS